MLLGSIQLHSYLEVTPQPLYYGTGCSSVGAIRFFFLAGGAAASASGAGSFAGLFAGLLTGVGGANKVGAMRFFFFALPAGDAGTAPGVAVVARLGRVGKDALAM